MCTSLHWTTRRTTQSTATGIGQKRGNTLTQVAPRLEGDIFKKLLKSPNVERHQSEGKSKLQGDSGVL
jgi:hypothetical protein